MREIINISLPPWLKSEVETAVKNGGYATTSEFFRDILRLWREDKLLRELKDSQREILAGKGKVLKSLKNLR